MIITEIIKPEYILDGGFIDKYFCCCLPGRNNKEHLDFCTVFEENNIIQGYAWDLYLTDKDYSIYKKSGNTKDLRKSLKEQIIQLLTIKN